MDKLRKIGLWIWYNKERMVLAIMFIALCYQLYKVWNPEPPEKTKVFVPASMETEGKVEIPQPPSPPRRNSPASITSLLGNPFTRMTGAARENAGGEESIKLLRIIKWSDGTLRAELQDSRERDYFKEGESFGTYEVLSINQEAGEVEVYSAESNKRLKLSVNK